MALDSQSLIQKAEKGINNYLEKNLRENKIDNQSYESAKKNTIQNLKNWFMTRILTKFLRTWKKESQARLQVKPGKIL